MKFRLSTEHGLRDYRERLDSIVQHRKHRMAFRNEFYSEVELDLVENQF